MSISIMIRPQNVGVYGNKIYYEQHTQCTLQGQGGNCVDRCVIKKASAGVSLTVLDASSTAKDSDPVEYDLIQRHQTSS